MSAQVQAVPARSLDANAKALAYLRIAVGVLFLIFGEYKVFKDGSIGLLRVAPTRS